MKNIKFKTRSKSFINGLKERADLFENGVIILRQSDVEEFEAMLWQAFKEGQESNI